MYEETNADPNSIGTEAQTSWSLANVGVKVRNKNETAKPFGNFYDFLALLVEFSSDGDFSPPNPSVFSGIRLFILIYQKIAVLC